MRACAQSLSDTEPQRFGSVVARTVEDCAGSRTQRMDTLGRLACGIAHDLHNVLTPILLGIDTLKGDISGARAEHVLAMVESNARRIADLADQVLSFTHGMAGRRMTVNTAHLIHDVERTARETFPATIETRTRIEPDLWPVSGDPTQIHQILLNLAVNARDAMEQGGTLTLGAANLTVDVPTARRMSGIAPGPFVALTVTDTGCGIPAHLVRKVFEPFFSTKGGRGNGIGLSTVAEIVRAHGGILKVHSRVGKGTRIIVGLPAVVESYVAA